MAKTKDIQRRIKSVANTKKITRAMEMVAASKMRKAVEAALASRTYANLSWETLLNLKKGSSGAGHPFLEERSEVKRQVIIVITSNRGLCGGFNSSLVNTVRHFIANQSVETELVLVGRKGQVLGAQHTIAADFNRPETGIDAQSVMPISQFVSESFLTNKYDRVLIAYTDFINAVKQVPRVKQFLPVVTEGDLGIVSREGHVGVDQNLIEEKMKKHSPQGVEYIFEPKPATVLNAIVPRLLEVQLYQAMLESSASEHSARMAAMHQATEAASDLGIELTLFYNKARQAAITAEIAEITAGVAALN